MVSLKGGVVPTCRCFLSILLSTNSWNPRALKLTEALNHWQSVVFSHEADINVYSIHSDAITKKKHSKQINFIEVWFQVATLQK